ncbi:cytochrome P450 [Conexibacter sp. SYSU D00693]|uniref:cytochrome P450 n=1 Tax=Conexibacter sp. SYSU D00693 TaxID=2812560 RepID=UPI00196A99FD|nr:cytochrome P450 [Conexibacter sp. SYSU D00693]
MAATLSPVAAPAPPGPRGAEGALWLGRLARDPWSTPAKLLARYGDVVRLPVPFTEVVLLGHPDHIAHVNLKAADRYERAPMVTETMRVQGSPHHASWFDGDDAEWERGRKLLQPHFTQKALTQLGALFTEAVVDEVDSWARAADTGEPFDLTDPLKELALAVLYNGMFSQRIAPEEMPGLLHDLDERMLATTARTAMSPLPSWIPRPLDRRGGPADDRLDDYLRGIIERRRAAPIDRVDLLNVLLEATYDDGTPLEDHKIRTEMLFLVIGGHETTAAALAWTFALLATHPGVADRLRDEVDALGDEAVGPQHMARLPFVTACFDEAARLQGGLVFNPKRAVEDDEIGGLRIARGTTVLHSNLALHRDPRFWGADAGAFRPDRWLGDDPPPHAVFQNFGRGRRMCLGKRLAYIEAVLTLATAFQRYRFEAPPGWAPEHHYRMSMGVKGGVPLKLWRR